MYIFIFTNSAKKVFAKHDSSIQERVLEKLKTFKKHPNIFDICAPLKNLDPATHKLRVGNYRLILKFEGNNAFRILDFGHRR